MNRLSAIDAFSPALARVGAMLLRPFRLGDWIKMGFIGLLGGGLATFSLNTNVRAPMFPPHSGGGADDPWGEIEKAVRSVHLADYFHIIVGVLAIVLVISLIFMYLFCRFRFVLFDSVITGRPTVGRGWRQYASQANRFFGFWLAFRLVSWGALALIVGAPLWHAYKSGVFNEDNSVATLFELLASVVLGAIAVGAVMAIVSTLMKDFIMPIMALDDFTLGDAWSTLGRVIASEPGAWAGYLGMKVVFAIGVGIALAIAMVVAMIPAIIIIGIPVAVLAIPGAFAFKAGATAVAILLFVIAGLLAAAGFFCVYLIVIAPATVFFTSYAFYFFGGRYPKLGALLSPQPLPPSSAPQVIGTQPVA